MIFEIGADVTNLQAPWDLSAISCEASRDPGPLTPRDPLAGRMRAAVTHMAERAQLAASGQLFADGTYVVGSEVQPDTYAIDGKITDCYWARMDARGEIIDNNFISGAGRVEVTIRPGDHSFTSEGCGEWRKVS